MSSSSLILQSFDGAWFRWDTFFLQKLWCISLYGVQSSLRHLFISLDSDRPVFVSDTIPHALLQTPHKKAARPKSHQIAPEKPLCGRKTALWRSKREWEEPGWRGGREKVLYEELRWKSSLWNFFLPQTATKEDSLRKLSPRSNGTITSVVIEHRNMEIEINISLGRHPKKKIF